MGNQLSASGTSKADVLEAFKVLAAAGEPAAPKSEDGAEADQPAMIKKSKIEVNFPEHNDQLEEPTMYAGDAVYMFERMTGGGDAADPEYAYTPFVDDMFTR